MPFKNLTERFKIEIMRSVEEVLVNLQSSEFRRSVALRKKEIEYLKVKGMTTILDHARDFIEKRLAPAEPANDGKQTPWRNHPVFVAQHATATCCRGCLQKWHEIPKGRELNPEEKEHILKIIESWLSSYLNDPH